MNFEFATAGKIIFGNGTLLQAVPSAATYGKRVLVVTGQNVSRAKPLLDALKKENMDVSIFCVGFEPTIDDAREVAKILADVVIGYGGGSVIDMAKAAAALMTNKGDVLEYLEVIGDGKPLTEIPVPSIAIPTTAGTGAEVTKNAVLASKEHKVKVSMRHPMMIPNVAIVDPECTMSMPKKVTASTGLDALTQLLEAFISKKSTPITDGICREGLLRATRSLKKAYDDGTDLKAREDMAMASLFGGLALANAGLGAVHGFAGPIGGMFSAPHGMVCAALLPHVMKINFSVMSDSARARAEEFSHIVGGSSVKDGIDWLAKICSDLQVPSLSSLGINKSDFPAIVEKSKNASSMKGNPIELSDIQLTHILEESFAC